MRNYAPVYIDGTTDLHTSSVKDLASSDMHARAMTLLKRDRGVNVSEYASIARALSITDEALREKTKEV